MAKHAKKSQNKLLIAACSVSAFLILISWSWLLLYIPPISNNAEGFLNKYLKISEDYSETTTSSEDKNSQSKETQETKSSENVTENDTVNDTENNVPAKPTIRLKIYEGPLYSASDDTCYYKVKAVVTGRPAPTIKFSKDDSEGLLGSGMAQINLKRNMKTYTLTATASNSQGTVMDSITLNWGCNSNPAISEVKLSSDIVYVDKQYELTVKASDSDGDKLTYKWTVSGGALIADNLETVKWNTPSKSDNYEVKVVVQDSKGASSSKSIPVYVGSVEVAQTTQPPQTSPSTTAPPTTSPPTSPQQTSLDLPKKTNEGGYLEYGGETFAGGNIYAGDSANNKPCVGFISFNIASIAGKTIEAATLTLGSAAVQGDPLEYLDAFWINVVEWGAEPIIQSDFILQGIAIQSFNSSNITCTAEKLKSELQKAINNGKSRFQIRVHFSGPWTDTDGSRDGWEYAQTSVNLNVKYN
ncbi:MAG: hypothetical protein KJ770_01880 [Actinobacteria bacterium]|nr:hypothetical protein [Actinomycetota bacterium]